MYPHVGKQGDLWDCDETTHRRKPLGSALFCGYCWRSCARYTGWEQRGVSNNVLPCTHLKTKNGMFGANRLLERFLQAKRGGRIRTDNATHDQYCASSLPFMRRCTSPARTSSIAPICSCLCLYRSGFNFESSFRAEGSHIFRKAGVCPETYRLERARGDTHLSGFSDDVRNSSKSTSSSADWGEGGIEGG